MAEMSFLIHTICFLLMYNIYSILTSACTFGDNPRLYICRGPDTFPFVLPTGVQIVKLYGVTVPIHFAFSNQSWKLVREIHVYGNVQTTLSGDVLEGLCSLQTFRWTDGPLRDISTLNFTYVSNIEVLDLSENEYLTFNSVTDALESSPLEKLRVLLLNGINLAGNGGSLSERFYQALSPTKLNILNVSRGGLHYVEPGIDQHLPFLNFIALSAVTLHGDRDFLMDLLNISTLEKINFNRIRLFSRIGYSKEPLITNVTKSELGGRLMDSLCLTTLKSLSLRGVFHRQYIELFGDLLVCEDYHGVLQMEELWLDNNNIRKLNLTVRGFDNLETLTLAYNIIENISHNFFRFMYALKYIDLSDNRLWKMLKNDLFADLFQYNERLEYVDISYNRLDILPKRLFKNNMFLKYLILRNNNLLKVDIMLANTNSLEILDVTHNTISSISELTRESLEQIYKNQISRYFSNETSPKQLFVNLTSNNLICSCDFKSFLEWMLTTNITVQNGNNNTCLYNGKPFPLTDDILALVSGTCTGENTGDVVIYACMGAVSVIMIIILVFCISRRRRSTKYKDKVKKLRARINTNCNELQTEKFLAFVAYSHVNKDFVLRTFYPTLKRKLLDALNLEATSDLVCINDKDFRPGEDIDEEVLRCVSNSDVTILLISSASTESQWSRFETYVAHEYSKPIFLVFLEKVKIDLLPVIVRSHFLTKVRLVWPLEGGNEAVDIFWKSLCKAILRHSKSNDNHSG